MFKDLEKAILKMVFALFALGFLMGVLADACVDLIKDYKVEIKKKGE